MKTLPSKELMSTVFEIEVTKVMPVLGALLHYRIILESSEYDGMGYSTIEKTAYINIYELAHMVKEWIDIKGYYIVQDTRGYTKVARFGAESRKFWEDETYKYDRTFDCGEWVLKEISK